MLTFPSALARVLDPLSQLLRKPLQIVDGGSILASSQPSVRLDEHRIAIITSGTPPLAEGERNLIRELLELVHRSEESEARYRELEQRMLEMQRENLDLIVKNRRLSEVSSTDALTGLYNRRFVVEKIDSEINRSVRHGSPLSLLMLDVDHFKRINDTWGHAAGDQVLQTIGRLLRESCRVYDVPGRYGGEEFCILLPETKLESTNVVAERIRRRLESTELSCGSASIGVTASIGIAGFDSRSGGSLSPAELIDRADQALYWAKNRGRNRIETWDEPLYAGAEAAVGH